MTQSFLRIKKDGLTANHMDYATATIIPVMLHAVQQTQMQQARVVGVFVLELC